MMDNAYTIWIVIAICFITMISISIYNFVRIGNLKNSTADLEISLKNESESNDKHNNDSIMSNISQVKSELRDDMKSNMEHIMKEQRDVDSEQDKLISKNVKDITVVNSNITFDINPQLVEFDGNFKSLEGTVISNKNDINSLSKSMTQLSSQYETQHSQLRDDIKKINDSQFEDKISALRTTQSKIKTDLVGINVNKQSIANNKVQIATNLKGIETNISGLSDMSGDFMNLAESTLDIANIVDNHDLIVKSM